MSETNQQIRNLLAVLEDRRHTLQQIYATTERALTQEVAQLGRTSVSALIVAGLVENYYTCLETIFVRISQFFENSLDPARWHSDLLAWLRVYSASTPGVSVLDNATVRLDLDNEPQPDVLMRIKPADIGRSRLDADDYVSGAPELVVEVVASSAAYDLHDKLHAYRRNRVLEYLVWRIYDDVIDWFVLTEDEYRPLAPDAAGILYSQTFAGLRLASNALLAGDFAGVLSELSNGIATPEHSAFVAKLGSASAR